MLYRTPVDEGPGFLFDGQWADLDDVLLAAGLHPNSFDQVAVVDKKVWGGRRALPLQEQFARLEHAEHGDVWFEIRSTDVDEGDDDYVTESPYIVSMSPSHDRRTKSHKPRQFGDNDWDDVLEFVATWADLALKEVRARGGRRERRERGQQSWHEFVATQQQGPLALTSIVGIIDNEVPQILEESLRRVGIVDRRTIERILDRLRGHSEELLEVLAERGPDVVEQLGLILLRDVRKELTSAVARALVSEFMDGMNTLFEIMHG